MRIETVLLGIGIASIVAGSAFVEQKPAAQSTADKLFAKAKEDDFTGSTACAECHESKVDNFAHSAHYAFSQIEDLPLNKRGCEGCHGPGKIHTQEKDPEVIAFKKMSPKESSAACLRCHSSTMKSADYHRTEHGRGNVACVSCHQIHPDTPNEFNEKTLPALELRKAFFAAQKSSPKLLKADESLLCASCHRGEAAEFRQNSRHPVPEGKLVCSDCHNPHPTRKTTGRREFLRDKCVTCHTEYAGPFAYEHDPVAGNIGEGCLECHKAHGSHNPDLLKGFSRGLCAQCHTDKSTVHYPGRTCWTSGCHVAVHGSNRSALFFEHGEVDSKARKSK